MSETAQAGSFNPAAGAYSDAKTAQKQKILYWQQENLRVFNDQLKLYHSLCWPISYYELAEFKSSLAVGVPGGSALLPSNAQLQQIASTLTARAEKGCP